MTRWSLEIGEVVLSISSLWVGADRAAAVADSALRLAADSLDELVPAAESDVLADAPLEEVLELPSANPDEAAAAKAIALAITRAVSKCARRNGGGC